MIDERDALLAEAAELTKALRRRTQLLQRARAAIVAELAAFESAEVARDPLMRRKARLAVAIEGELQRHDRRAGAVPPEVAPDVEVTLRGEDVRRGAIDPRPRCVRCGERWLPPEGIDATVYPCRVCGFDSVLESAPGEGRKYLGAGRYEED